MKVTGKPTEEDRKLIKHLMDTEMKFKLAENLQDELIDFGRVMEYDSCELITCSGDIDTNVYILMEGIIRNWHWSQDNEKTSYFASPGTMFMSLHSYMNNEPSSCNIETCCESRIFAIGKKSYEYMINTHHEFAKWSLKNTMYQLYYYEFKDSVINGTVRERYDALINDRPEIIQKVHLKTIASYLGITPQYLSRLRRSK